MGPYWVEIAKLSSSLNVQFSSYLRQTLEGHWSPRGNVSQLLFLAIGKVSNCCGTWNFSIGVNGNLKIEYLGNGHIVGILRTAYVGYFSCVIFGFSLGSFGAICKFPILRFWKGHFSHRGFIQFQHNFLESRIIMGEYMRFFFYIHGTLKVNSPRLHCY